MISMIKRLLTGTTTSTVSRTGPLISFVNQTTVLTDDQVKIAMAALQIQLDRDFYPIWKLNATLTFVPAGQQPSPYAWIMYIMDTSDQVGALGYHDLTTAGNPIGRVFVKDDQKYGLSWTVTTSHELLEMLVDPYIEEVAFNQKTALTGTLYAYEVCDAIEDDGIGYFINNVHLSDFVYPSWFEGWRPANSCKFDHHGAINAPFALAPGGYISLFEVGPNSRGWTQKFAEGGPGKRALSKAASSRAKRRETKII